MQQQVAAAAKLGQLSIAADVVRTMSGDAVVLSVYSVPTTEAATMANSHTISRYMFGAPEGQVMHHACGARRPSLTPSPTPPQARPSTV